MTTSSLAFRRFVAHLFGRRAIGPATTVVDQAIVAGSNFLILILLARRLPVETFGVYVVALAILNALLGIHGALVTFPLSIHGTAEGSEDTLEYVRGAGHLHVLQATSLALLALVLSYVLPWSGAWADILLVVGILQLPYQLNDYVRRLLLARHALGSLVRHDAVTSAARLLAVLILVRPTSTGITDFTGALFLGFCVGIVCHFVFDERANWFAAKAERVPSPGRAARRNWPLTRLMLPEVLSYQLATQAFLILSTTFLEATEVAVLGGLQAIANMINVFLAGLTNHGLVDLTRSRHHDDAKAWRSSAVFMGGTAFAFTGLCSLSFFLMPLPLIRLFYGRETYMAGYPHVLQLFGLVMLARTGSVLLITVLRSVQAQAVITRATLVSGAVSIVIAGPFMLSWGLPGAVYGLLSAQLVLLITLVGQGRPGWRPDHTGRERRT